MPTVADLLKTTNVGNFKAPPRFPGGNYVMKILSYDMLPFHWKKNDTHGLAYVPTLKPVSCIELDDDENPEVQKEMDAALQKYGDWTAREFQFAYTQRDSGIKMATIAPVNFPLLECDSDGEPIGIMEKQAWRFYLREDGEEQGFVADVLGLSFPSDTDLGDVLEATVDKKLLVHVAWVPRHDDPSKSNLEFESITAAP